MVTIKTGNVLQATEDIIAHQVNCYGVAGGLASAVFDAFPDAGKEYDECIKKNAPESLLGGIQLLQYDDGTAVANLFGQLLPGMDYRPKALESALTLLANAARGTGKSVAIPWRISCGICGGDWKEVQQIIERTMNGVNCVIYRREQDR